MHFIGQALPLRDGDVEIIAGYLGCEIAAVRALLQVESAGRSFGNDGKPVILNEPHILYRELGAGAKRNEAVSQGLAYQRWGAKPYPRSQPERYAWLRKAMAIDETAALRSCSYGGPQIMGFNHKVCGFDTVQEFVEAMKHSEGAQIYCMARFIVSNGLQRHLRSKDWTAFARGYNGAGYAKNQYHTKLANAYNRRPASEKTTPEPSSVEQVMSLLGNVPSQKPTQPQQPKPAPTQPKAPETPQTSNAGSLVALAIMAALVGAAIWFFS